MRRAPIHANSLDASQQVGLKGIARLGQTTSIFFKRSNSSLHRQRKASDQRHGLRPSATLALLSTAGEKRGERRTPTNQESANTGWTVNLVTRYRQARRRQFME
jgi:hypothetical protein